MSTIYKYHINVNAEESEVVKKLLNSEVLLNRGKKEEKQVDFIKIDDPNGAAPGADVTLYVGINDTIDKIIYDAYCDPYTGHFSRFTEDGKAAYIKSDGTLDLEKVYDDLDENNLNFLHLALEEALKNISEEDGESASAKRIGRRSEEGALATAPKPDRERNHPLRDAFAKLRAGKTEEPTTPVTGKLIDDYEGFKVKADRHLTNTSTRIDNMLGAMEKCVGLADVSGLTSQQITTLLLQAEGALNIDKGGLKSWRDGLQNVITQIPNPTSLSADQLTGGNEASRNKKIEEIKKGYADYKAKMEAKIEEADKVLALTEKVLKLEVKDFKTQLPGLRAELRNLQNPATPAPTDDDDEVESTDLDAPLTRAERRAAERKRKEDEASRAAVADAVEESGLEDMGLPEVLEPYSTHRFVTPLPGILQRVDTFVADTDKLIEKIRAEEDAEDFVFDDSVEKSEIETERDRKSAIVDTRLKAVDEQWKALETQRKYLDITKQSLENMDTIDWGSMASKTEAKASVIGFYKKQISKITKKQDELKNDLEPDLKVIRRQIDDDANNAYTTSRSSASGATGTSTPSTSGSATVTSAVLGGVTTTTTVKLTADSNPVTAGNKVTVRFSANVDPSTLSLTAGIAGKPTQALEIKLESGNNYKAEFDVPGDTKEGQIKFSLTSEDLKTVGSLSIDVKAAPATPSAPVPGSNISKLKVEAKPSKVKPGDTVTLDITAWGVDGKKAEGLTRFLEAKAKTSNGTGFNLTISNKGNGKYEATFTVPTEAPEGDVTFNVSSKVKTEVKATTTAEIKPSKSSASAPKEDLAQTPDHLEISINKQTFEPGEEVTVTLNLINKAGNSDNMDGYTPNITIGSKQAIVTPNRNGTYTGTYTIPNTTADGTTLAVSGSIHTAGLTPATANITVSLPAPTTAPDQFFGFNSILGANVTANTKLTPLTKRLNAEIRAQWVDSGSLSEIEKIKKQAELATKIVDIIGNASDIDSKTKSAYFAQATLELDDIYQKIDKGVISLSKKQANVGQEKIDKVNQLLELENAKKDISNAKYRINKYTKPATYIERGNSITSPIARGYDLLVQNSNDATVAELLELHFSYSTNAKTLIELKTAYSIFQDKITNMTTSELTGVSASQRDSVLLELRSETKQTLDIINNKLKPKVEAEGFN